MALESEIPLEPECAPHKLRPVFDGAYDEKCSVKYFRDFLPDSEGCEETSPDKKWVSHLRTFWYPDEAPSRSQPPLNSIQPKIKDFLFSLENVMPNYWGMAAFVQFWAPVTAEDGRRTLSVSKQPFAARHNLKGLFRYRYYCQELGRIGNGMDFGPVGRAYAMGSLECSPNSEVYTEDDFLLKNHAKHCGGVGYLALPVFELANDDTDGQERSCVGVLEFISFMINNLSSFDIRICMKKLKKLVYETKRGEERVPFLTSLASLVSEVIWSIYGFLVSDMFIMVPNIVGILLYFIQLVHASKYKSPLLQIAEEMGSLSIILFEPDLVLLQP